jgi:hypothetical protein
MYEEIKELYKYCQDLGMEVSLESFLDGYAIRFADESDVVQHCRSYGGASGYVEPVIGCDLDYTAVELGQAKDLIRYYKSDLITVHKDLEIKFSFSELTDDKSHSD